MVNGMINKHMPVYNIKAVSRLIGLLPVTLRAWERRYGMPSPQRGNQGYRLYSDYDVRTLKWLKTQIESGLSISRAVEYLGELRSTGKDPVAQADMHLPAVTPITLSHLEGELTTALRHLDEGAACEIMERAFAMHPADRVLVDVMQPTLVSIGEAWHSGELPIATEHFASQFCLQYLHSMIHPAAGMGRPGLIVAACAPKEQHQIGLLMLVTMLRLRGWDVRYLGPDLSLERLEESLAPLHPDMLLLSATRSDSIQGLHQISIVLNKFPEPRPLIVLGGQAFQSSNLPEDIPAIILDTKTGEAVERIEELMDSILKNRHRGHRNYEKQ